MSLTGLLGVRATDYFGTWRNEPSQWAVALDRERKWRADL